MSAAFLKKNKEIILENYRKTKEAFPDLMAGIDAAIQKCEDRTALALSFLYSTMPLSDMVNYSFETILDYAAHGVFLWETMERVRELPEDVYLQYVLYHRVNEEEIRPCRRLFYEHIQGRLPETGAVQNALEVNFWCAENGTYRSDDIRTISARAFYERGYGRCGEESCFTVNALRSVGIPARQVYVPRWAHCDDNHAWIEILCDGKWYFTGACEPMMILNRGWFSNASSRAVLVHSRYFGRYGTYRDTLPEKSLARDGAAEELNQTFRYAVTEQVHIRVVNEQGDGCPHAAVKLFLMNEAQLIRIAALETGEQGEAVVELGAGSVFLRVEQGELFAERILHIHEENTVTLCLQEREKAELFHRAAEWEDLTFYAPKDAPVNPDRPTQEQTEEGKNRARLAQEIRLARTGAWQNPETELFLERSASPNERDLRRKLLESLSAKDRTDVSSDVLEEHFVMSREYFRQYPEEISVRYVMNPRIGYEILQPYRREILSAFSEEEKISFQEEPGAIMDWIRSNIKEAPERERSTVFTAPSGLIRGRVGSRASKDILFAAIARTLGIPARLRPTDLVPEYWNGKEFVTVDPLLQENGRICFLAEEGQHWNYGVNWSLGRCTEQGVETLALSGKWIKGRMEAAVTPGEYRILTANRLPNGNIFGAQKYFKVRQGETAEIRMYLRQASLSSMMQQISLPPFSLETAEGSTEEGDTLTEGKRKILFFLEEGEEPTEHILNELLQQKDEFARYEDRLLFVVRSRSAADDPLLQKVLSVFPGCSLYYDDFEDTVELLARAMYVDPDALPLIVMTDGSLTGIYGTSGYNVGTGVMLCRFLKAEEYPE